MIFNKYNKVTKLLALSLCIASVMIPNCESVLTYAEQQTIESNNESFSFDFREFQVTVIDNQAYVSGISNTYKNSKVLLDIYVPRIVYYEDETTGEVIEYEIVGITDYAFEKCKVIKSIVFDCDIQSIPVEAFKDCTYLESVQFYGDVSVLNIGDYAFYNCENIHLEQPFWNNIKNIGKYSFSNCKNLITEDGSYQELYLDKVQSVGEYSFSNTNVLGVLFNSLESVPKGCFQGCNNLKVFCMNNSNNVDWLSVEDYAFDGCTSLEYVQNYEKIQNIGEYAFGNCVLLGKEFDGKINFINIQNIESHAFYNCKSIEWFYIDDIFETTYISEKSFIGCTSLKGFYRFLIGDNNFDKTINILDVLTLKNQILQNSDTKQYPNKCVENIVNISKDTNFDGSISAIDVLILKKKILGEL